jgi:hypothetical protein
MTLHRPEMRYKKQDYRTRAPENDVKRLPVHSVEKVSVFLSLPKRRVFQSSQRWTEQESEIR